MDCVALLVGWPKGQLCFLYKWAPFLVKQILYPSFHIAFLPLHIPFLKFERS